MYTYFKTKNGVAQNLIDDFFFLTFTVGNPSIGRASSEKNGGTRLLSEKTEALHAELCMKEQKQPSVVILQQSIFCNLAIRYLWLTVIRRSNKGVYFMNFPSQIIFNSIKFGYRAAIL